MVLIWRVLNWLIYRLPYLREPKVNPVPPCGPKSDMRDAIIQWSPEHSTMAAVLKKTEKERLARRELRRQMDILCVRLPGYETLAMEQRRELLELEREMGYVMGEKVLRGDKWQKS